MSLQLSKESGVTDNEVTITWFCPIGFRIDTGDWGVNGGPCFMHLVILYSIRYLLLLGIIRWAIINPFYWYILYSNRQRNCCITMTRRRKHRFSINILLTWISRLLCDKNAWFFCYVLVRPIWREECLKMLIQALVSVLLYIEDCFFGKKWKKYKSYPFFVIK